MSEIKSSVGRFKYLTGTTAASVDADVYAAKQARVARHIDTRAISAEDRKMLRAMLLGEGE